jgi:hypothetical protein
MVVHCASASGNECAPCPNGQRVARFGHLDMRAQAEVPSARRADTPKRRPFSASADVTSAPNTATRTQLGVSDRSALSSRNAGMPARFKSTGNLRRHTSRKRPEWHILCH